MAKRKRQKLPLWVWGLALAVAPLLALNLAVATCGRTVVFPLSPFFLREKAHALTAYARHRLDCVLVGHDGIDVLVRQTEARHKLPRHLLAALVMVESSQRVHRISPTGAMGLTQLMPGTARDLKVADPFDPASSLDGGARYLGWLLRRYHNKWPLALAAYNAGAGNVKDRVPHNGETEHYVRKVLAVHAGMRRVERAPRVAMK